jgi:hypothetical protein
MPRIDDRVRVRIEDEEVVIETETRRGIAPRGTTAAAAAGVEVAVRGAEIGGEIEAVRGHHILGARLARRLYWRGCR